METQKTYIESKIIENVENGLLNKDWFKATIFAIVSESADMVSIDLQIFNDNNLGTRYSYDNLFNISDYIRELKIAIGAKFNKVIITLFKEDKYDIEYIWDNDYYIQNEKNLAKASATILYERFYEILSFEILPDVNWGEAEVKSSIINDSTVNTVYTLNKEFDLILPQKWEKYLLTLHSKTNAGDVDIYWGAWDILVIQMRYEDNFFFDKDVQFRLMAKP